MKREKVILIGAGPAGLTAAYELLTRGDKFDIIVLEASSDIGGISKTVNYKGNRMDIGGHRFFSKSDRVMDWWLNIMPIDSAELDDNLTVKYHGQTKKVVTETKDSKMISNPDRVMLVRNRLSRIYFLRKFFSYPVSLSVETIKNLGVVRMFKILFSYLYIRVKPIKPEETLEDFFINRFGKALYLTFFKDYTEKVWGFKCNEISKDWGAQRIKGLSVSKTIKHALRSAIGSGKAKGISQKSTETSLIEKFLYPKLGPGQMWELVAEKIKQKGGQIILNSEVIGLKGNIKEGINEVVCRDENQNIISFSADLVFSTMPIKDLFEAFEFEVEPEVRQIATQLNYRDFITVGLLCHTLKVKDKNQPQELIQDNWIYIQERDVRIGRLQIFNNWSPHLVADKNTIWMGLEYFCNEGDDLWALEDSRFIQMAIQELEKIGIIDSDAVLDSTIVRVKKTYPAYTGSYADFPKVISYLNDLKNLYPIGRNGMHKYNNSDHSMLTAMVAVDNILANNTDKSNLWEINTEEEYHESK
jgi:protoporphyrinogen oxidase